MNKKSENPKYDVFISYSRQDYIDENNNVIPGNEISKIKDALTNAGITYWFDEEGIYSGQNFAEKIVINIEDAKIFLFLSTANSNKSRWTCKEIASADEFKKHIIPVRLDATPYNKTVLFRIADLDYIEYYTNPRKGMEDLIKSIQTYLEELAVEERRREEEKKRKEEIERERANMLRQQKEEEEKRKKDEEQQTIVKMQRKCMTLHNVESRLELARQELLVEIGLIHDVKLREELKEKIINGGPIHQKYQQKCRELTEKRDELERRTNVLTEEVNGLHSQLRVKSEDCRNFTIKNNELEQRTKELTKEVHDLHSQLGEKNEEYRKLKTRNNELERRTNKLTSDISDLHFQINEDKKNYWSIGKRVLIILCIVLFLVSISLGIVAGHISNNIANKRLSVINDSVSIYKEQYQSVIKDSILTPKERACIEKGISTSQVVDLGLSVKWAGWNIGATAPEEYGDYYAWGETTRKSNYSWSTYIWCKGNDSTITKYCTNSKYGIVDKRTILEPSDDVAHVKWGGNWRIPTSAEEQELRENCKWKLTTLNGVKGYKVTGPNGNSIFLPAAGYKNGSDVYFAGSEGFYWSKKLGFVSYDAKYWHFNSSSVGDYYNGYRYHGHSVRPVCE